MLKSVFVISVNRFQTGFKILQSLDFTAATRTAQKALNTERTESHATRCMCFSYTQPDHANTVVRFCVRCVTVRCFCVCTQKKHGCVWRTHIQVCLLLLAYGGVKSDGGHHGEL